MLTKTSQAAIILLQKILTKQAREKQHRSVGWPLSGQFRTHPSKARQTRHILPAASYEGSCAGTASASKTQLSVSPAAFVLFNRFHRTGCFTGMPVKFTLGKSRTAWTKFTVWQLRTSRLRCVKYVSWNLTQQFKWAPSFPFLRQL